MDSTDTTVSAQQWPLNSLDNDTALDYILAEQGSVCARANTSWMWINAFGEVKTQLHKIKTKYLGYSKFHLAIHSLVQLTTFRSGLEPSCKLGLECF